MGKKTRETKTKYEITKKQKKRENNDRNMVRGKSTKKKTRIETQQDHRLLATVFADKQKRENKKKLAHFSLEPVMYSRAFAFLDTLNNIVINDVVKKDSAYVHYTIHHHVASNKRQ